MVLIAQHAKEEPAGTLGQFLEQSKREVKIINLYKKDRFPDGLSDVEAVIAMGGPMNVYEEDRFPFLKAEDSFLKKVMNENIPILGICLGAQLLAKAAGAKVKRAPRAEMGWARVRLTKEGEKDQLCQGLDETLEVFQWHEDSFEIPKGAVRLAENDLCPNQAFRYRNNCYGLQFHVEIDAVLITEWTKSYCQDSDSRLRVKARDMLLDYYIHREKFNRQARRIYFNFSKLIGACKIPA